MQNFNIQFKYAAYAVIPYPLTQEIGADYLAFRAEVPPLAEFPEISPVRCKTPRLTAGNRLPLLLTNPFADTVMTRTHTNRGLSDSSAYLLLTFAQRI